LSVNFGRKRFLQIDSRFGRLFRKKKPESGGLGEPQLALVIAGYLNYIFLVSIL
jgi:hypothetical protein